MQYELIRRGINPAKMVYANDKLATFLDYELIRLGKKPMIYQKNSLAGPITFTKAMVKVAFFEPLGKKPGSEAAVLAPATPSYFL